MRKIKLLIVMVSAAVAMLLGALQRDIHAEAQLQAAINKEIVEGDLKAAIEQYRKIVTTHRANRAVAAKALVRMGQCYEKLGDAEARKAYEQVLRDYADQHELVAQARARLAALGAAPLEDEKRGPILTELKLPSGQETHALSPDGNKIAYTTRWEGTPRRANLVVRDLVSGTERQITHLKEGVAFTPIWSPDGKSIAYRVLLDLSHNEIRIVSLDTGEDRSTGISGLRQPLDWSRDGRYILYGGAAPGSDATLNLLPVGGGQPRTLFSASGEDLSAYRPSPRFSPDGKYVSFARRNKGASDVYLISTEGGEPVPITDHPAHDEDPIWTPDGQTLLFRSTRTFGRVDLWGVSVVGGKASGEPFVVKPDIGYARLFSLSNNGRLLFASGQGQCHIYVTAIDPRTNQPVGPPIRLTKDSAVANNWPVWSPDGKRIAYLSTSGLGPETMLRVMSADGSNDQEIVSVRSYPKGPFAWAPDNEHIFIPERPRGTGIGIYSVSTSTKEKKPVLLDPQIVGHVSCSPDGKRLAFLRVLKKSQAYLADVDGNNLRQVTFDDAVNVAYPTWSPDGKQLAFYRFGGARNALMLLTVEGGALTEVLGPPKSGNIFWTPSWSPDGSMIAWAAPGPASKPWFLLGAARAPELWFTRVSGAKPESFRVNLEVPEGIAYFCPSWSPDGTKMLFTAETDVYRLLLMENFLPKAAR